MNIGIDIDGVLTNDDDYILDYTIKYCFENNIPYYNEPYNFEIRKYNWDEETLESYRQKYFYNYVDNETPRRFASEIIKKIRKHGHKVFIITARYKSQEDTIEGEDMRKRISRWLEKHDIQYDKLIFTEPSKIKEIQKNSIDIMIEDSPITIPDISKVVPVLCYDTRYNRLLEGKNITKVFSWYDIYRRILAIEEENN